MKVIQLIESDRGKGNSVRKCKAHYVESDRLVFIGVVLYESLQLD